MNFKTSTRAMLMLVALFAFLPLMHAATPVVLEAGRSHAATGSYGCTVSGATVATPSVITCTAAHGLIDGDQVQIINVGGTTTVNTTGYAKITGYSTTTFGLYSDSALATGVTGTGTYTSGGTVSIAQDISGLSGDYTIRLTISSLTAAKNVAVCLQDSVDGYAATVTLGCANVSGPIVSASPVTYTWRKYQIPSLRLGTTNGRLRLNVQSIDSAATAVVSLAIEQ